MHLAKREMDKGPVTIWHLFPLHVQARRSIFFGIDKRHGKRFIDVHFPPSERASVRSSDLQIEMKNGSIWQMCGSDRYDALVGSNPAGVIFSEYALADPEAWNYIRPIISENDGFALFISTFRGRNHAYRMAMKMRSNPAWHVDIRTVEDTHDDDGQRIMTDADIQAERDEGMSEGLIQQEYYCNPMASPAGAVYC
jgi:hypothetical protein